MADGATGNYAWVKPEVAGSIGTWGTKVNATFEAIDGQVEATEDAAAAAQATADAALAKAGGIMSGRVNVFTDCKKYLDLASMSGVQNLDLTLNEVFIGTIIGVTSVTVSGVPAGGYATAVIMCLTNGGSHTVSWPASFKWPAGVPPALTASGKDLIAAITFDNGVTWMCSARLNLL